VTGQSRKNRSIGHGGVMVIRFTTGNQKETRTGETDPMFVYNRMCFDHCSSGVYRVVISISVLIALKCEMHVPNLFLVLSPEAVSPAHCMDRSTIAVVLIGGG